MPARLPTDAVLTLLTVATLSANLGATQDKGLGVSGDGD